MVLCFVLEYIALKPKPIYYKKSAFLQLHYKLNQCLCCNFRVVWLWHSRLTCYNQDVSAFPIDNVSESSPEQDIGKVIWLKVDTTTLDYKSPMALDLALDSICSPIAFVNISFSIGTMPVHVMRGFVWCMANTRTACVKKSLQNNPQ